MHQIVILWLKLLQAVYETEIRNHEEMGDDGECWFGEEAMYRMIRKLEVFRSFSHKRVTVLSSACAIVMV